MARGKKKENLSPEEKLEQALVPVEEQPYEVPENWCWVHLLESFENLTDSNKKVQQKKYLNDGRIPIIDQGKVLIGGYTNDEDMAYTGELPVVIFGDHTRCIKYIDYQFAQGADGVKVLRPKAFWNVKAFFYAFQSLAIPDMGYRRHYPLFKNYYIPLPPLGEQRRIVEQIENLFMKLTEAEEKGKSALDELDTRRDAILYMAFSGELSSKWRKRNSIEYQYNCVTFSDVLDVRDGTHDSPQYFDEGYPLITSKNLKNGAIIDKDIKYICKDDYDKINQRSKVDVGDILFAMIGTIGNPVVVEEEPYYAIKNMALFKNIDKVNPYYIKYYLESREIRERMKKEAKGTTQKFVSLGYLRNFPVPLPTKEEQVYIVNKLDGLFFKEHKIREKLKYVMERVELLKKSILAKAFRGELGTNNPEEESAIELLRSVLSNK